MAMLKIRLLIATCALLAAGCAAFEPGPPPLTRADVVQLTRAGETPAAIVARLKSTGTVLWLTASDIVEMRQSGVSTEVLDHLQAAQLAEMRLRAQFDMMLYGPERSPFSRCGGFPPRGGRYDGFFAPFC
jgi:hypothetical protein